MTSHLHLLTLSTCPLWPLTCPHKIPRPKVHVGSVEKQLPDIFGSSVLQVLHLRNTGSGYCRKRREVATFFLPKLFIETFYRNYLNDCYVFKSRKLTTTERVLALSVDFFFGGGGRASFCIKSFQQIHFSWLSATKMNNIAIQTLNLSR